MTMEILEAASQVAPHSGLVKHLMLQAASVETVAAAATEA
jgi:hypothetical protein